ncbi:MAG: hypothetical protein KAT58_10285 [candidate division Zixibacteria bacterium]|nr:hypothetical protein [candidate division Zixibacteria bacterium]
MRKSFVSLALTAFAVIVVASSSFAIAAAIPHMINYQGMLTDNLGNPLTGNYSIEFKIFNHPTAGTQLWGETHGGVVVTDGLFNVLLGSATPINLDFSGEYYLDITVGGEHLATRLPFTSVGYAYRAQRADTALYVPGVSSVNFDDTYVNVLSADSMRSTASVAQVLKLRSTSTNTDAIRIYTHGTGDADGIIIYTAGTTADGIYIDTAGDCGIEVRDCGSDGIYMDDIHDDGIYMYDVDGHGVYMHDIEGDGIYVYDAAEYGLHVKNTGNDAIYIESPTKRAITINSSGDNFHAIKVEHGGVSGLYVASADDYAIYAKGDEGNKLATNSASYYGLYVASYSQSSANKGLYVYGTTHATGGFSKRLAGDKPAFCIVSPDVEIMASGSGRVVNGQAQITFEEDFAAAISDEIPVKVVVTAIDAPSALLYVANKSTAGFSVQPMEIKGMALSTDDISFDWIAIARQKGFERRPEIEAPVEEDNRDLAERQGEELQRQARRERDAQKEAARRAHEIEEERARSQEQQ